MGELLTRDGMRPDPQKVQAIKDMQVPDSKKAVQRLLGCVNYLSRYIPKLAEISEPLRRLIEKSTVFVWQSQQEEAFNHIKQLISEATVLKYYDVDEEVTIQCNASEKGLGATFGRGYPLPR